MIERVDATLADVAESVAPFFDAPSVLARFEGAGTVAPETARAIGLVGPAARACGIERDVRAQLPAGVFEAARIPVSTWPSGDVFGRAFVRWLEIERSAAFVREQLASLPGGAIGSACPAPVGDRICVSLVEGWRGELCHVAATDANGGLAAYKVVDASFHNWTGLALALRGQPISDFPLCNKSFNLSYCGFDL
jgi:Ni,Fe-hydrogenase III large subunit